MISMPAADWYDPAARYAGWLTSPRCPFADVKLTKIILRAEISAAIVGLVGPVLLYYLGVWVIERLLTYMGSS